MWSSRVKYKKMADRKFKENQRQYLYRMVRPTLWTKIRFYFWRAYWKLFMPNEVYIHIGVFSNYCIYKDGDYEYSGCLNGMLNKDKIKYIKWFAKYNRRRNADVSV